MTDLCVIDWGALATFTTGILAVGAAVYVGRKQTAITHRQADIQSEQVKIQQRQTEIADRVASAEESRVRLEIFGKRYAFVETVNAFMRRVKAKNEVWTDEDAQFLAGAKEAEFLFPRSLKTIIDEMWLLAGEYQDAAHSLQSHDPAVVKDAHADRKRLRAKLDAASNQFMELCDREMRPFDN